MVALLNSPVLTSYGSFEYSPIGLEEAKERLKLGFISFIGHSSTCEILKILFQVEVPLNRSRYQQQAGELALVFNLNKRLAVGEVLHTIEEIEGAGYQLGLLLKRD